MRKKLSELEQRYYELFDSVKDGIVISNMNGRIRRTNKAFRNMLGYKAKEIIKLTCQQLTPAKWHKMEEEIIQSKILKRGFSNEYEKEYIRKDGTVIPIRIKVWLIRDRSGKPEGMWAVVTDVTERKVSEETLRQSEERFRSMVEVTSDWTWEVDVNGTYTYSSPRIKDMLGFEPYEVIGQKPFDFMDIEEAQRLEDEFAAILKSGKPFSGLENVNIHKNGQKIILETCGVPIFNSQGELCGYRGIDRDITDRKRTEEALRRSESQYRLLVDNANEAISVICDDRICFANPRHLELSGYTLKELASRPFQDFIHPEDRKMIIELYSKRYETETDPNVYQIRVLDKNGNVKYIECKTELISWEGKPAVLAFSIDITERKRAEEALRASEEKFRVVFESAADGISMTDISGNILDVNEAALRTHGCKKKEELIGQNGLSSVSPEDLAAAREDLINILREGYIGPKQYTLLRKSGAKYPSEVNVTAIRDKSGNPIGTITVSRDITERRRIENALRQSEEKLRAMFKSIADGIIVNDFDGIPRDVNETILQQTGYEREEVVGQAKFLLLAPSDVERAQNNLDRMLREGYIGPTEYTFVRKDGTEYPVEINASIIEDAAGNPEAIITIIRDITERKLIEEALRESEEKYRSLMNNIPDTVWTATADGKFTFVSPNAEAVSGYSIEELYQGGYKLLFTKIHPDDVLTIIERLKSKVKYGLPFDIEYRYQEKDGGWVWLNSKATTSYQKNGIDYMDGVTVDITERKRAEEALRESEERFRRLAENAQDVIYRLSLVPALKMDYISPAIKTMVGYTPEEFYADPYLAQKITFPEDRLPSEWTQPSSDRKNVPIVMRQFHKDGSIVWTEQIIVPIYDQEGKLVAYEGITRNVTERIQIEDALRKSEAEYRLLVENANEGIAVACEGMLVFVNPKLLQMTGYTSEDLAARPFTDFIHQDDRGMVYENYIARLSGKKFLEVYHFRIIDKNGNIKWLEIHAVLISWKNKPATLNFMSDITERRLAEEALKKSEAEYRLLVENSHDGIIVVSDGKIQYTTPRVTEIAGYSKEEMISRSFSDVLKSDDMEMILRRYQQRIEGETLPTNYDIKLIDKSGSIKWVNVNAVLVSWEGRPATLNFINDITLRKKLEGQLKEYSEELERMVEKRTRELQEAQEKLIRNEKLATIGQLAGSIGHELRNPLAAIRTSAYFIKVKLGDSAEDKVRNHLDMLDKQVGACDRIITDILDFARPGKINIGQFDFNQLILEQIKNLSIPKNVEVQNEMAEGLARVKIDAGQMERVLSNLVSNAVQSMPYGGKLTFTTNQSEGFVELRISDTGEGISEENLKKVFEPLYTTRSKGVGLGLSIAKALVERQGGIIGVESKLGKGATFIVKLPIVDEEVHKHE